MKDHAMNGTVALITGASSGIGRATTIAFARSGSYVVGVGLNPELGAETMTLVHHAGGEGIFIEADVTKADQLEAMMSKTIDTFGRLDYAFNNAGIAGRTCPSAELSVEEWRRVIDVNLTGVWLCMKYEIPRMLEQGGGAIVNCSSVLGLVGFAGNSVYAASKHGIIGLTKSAALDYAGQGMRIMAVCPGIIETPMVEVAVGTSEEARAPLLSLEPVGRLGEPQEIADAVVWLCSDQASFVTGTALVIDGGWIAGYRLG